MAFRKGDPRINRAGRPRGARSKVRSKILSEVHRQMVAGEQITPLQFLLRVLNDPKAPIKDRLYAASAAAPYIHQRKAVQVEGSGDRHKPLVLATMNQLRRLSDKELDVLVRVVARFAETGIEEEARVVGAAPPRIRTQAH